VREVRAQDVMAKLGVGRAVGYGRLRALVDHGLRTGDRPAGTGTRWRAGAPLAGAAEAA
jgi:hypothetical protein